MDGRPATPRTPNTIVEHDPLGVINEPEEENSRHQDNPLEEMESSSRVRLVDAEDTL